MIARELRCMCVCVCVHTLLASGGLSSSLLQTAASSYLSPDISRVKLKKPLPFAFHSFFLFCSRPDGCAVHVSPHRPETTDEERLNALLKSTA